MSSQQLPGPISINTTRALSELEIFRNRILKSLLVGATSLGGIAYFLVIYATVNSQLWLAVGLYSAVYAWLIIVTFSKKASYTFRLFSFTSVLYILAMISLTGSGIKSNVGLLILLTITILITIMTNTRVGILTLVLTLASIGMVIFGNIVGWLPFAQLDLMGTTIDPIMVWVLNTSVFITMAVIMLSALNVILSGLYQTLETQKRSAAEINKERDSLEQRVEERTLEIQKRASQQQAASQVARAVSTQANLDDILNIATVQIQNQFGYYHAGIFLVDEKREFAVLRAATSDGGRQMIANNHKLRVGEEGIVGYVVAKGEPRIAVDVGLDAVHFVNPYLNETRSEIALPLRTTTGTIGALDVQSREETAFTTDDLDMLQTIADQLAGAIERSLMLDALQKRVDELESSYQKMTKKSWQDFISQTQRQVAFRMSRNDSNPTAIPVRNDAQTSMAIEQGATIIEKATVESADGQSTLVAVPIKLREQTIGVVKFNFQSATIPQDTLDMLETSASRLAIALENVRLLDEVQTRAEREHLVSDLSSKIRSTSEIDRILRTTAEELGRLLGVSQVTVQLRKEDAN